MCTPGNFPEPDAGLRMTVLTGRWPLKHRQHHDTVCVNQLPRGLILLSGLEFDTDVMSADGRWRGCVPAVMTMLQPGRQQRKWLGRALQSQNLGVRLLASWKAPPLRPQ